MASHQDPRKAPKPEIRRVVDKPKTTERSTKRPEPKRPPKPIYSDWAMF
jgi:hypothetical protein